MTVGPIEVRWQISLGNVLQIILLLALAVGIVTRNEVKIAGLKETTSIVSSRVDRQQSATTSQLVEARSRIGALEVQNARTEEKFTNILAILHQIQKRLDQDD